MEALLLLEEETLRSELRADNLIDKNRDQSVQRLHRAFGETLLRYNAACAGDRTRQALADCVTATAEEMLGLLTAGTVKKEGEGRRLRPGAVFVLLIAVICALAAALLIRRYLTVGCVLLLVCALCLFLSGRFWFREGEVRIRAGLDPELLWKVLRRTGETMDRKIDAFCEQARAREAELAAETAAARAPDDRELKLFGDLLEALYADNGDYALRRLKKLLPYLEGRGIELRDYDAENAALFEVLPTKNKSLTLRPALLSGEKLLLSGRAAEHTD